MVNTLSFATVIVPRRGPPLLAATLYVMVFVPPRLELPNTVIHDALLTACQFSVDGLTLTIKVPLPDADRNVASRGESVTEGVVADCTTVNFVVPRVMTPLRVP